MFGASLTDAGQVVIRSTGRIHANLAILMSSQLKRGCERVGAASRHKRLDRDEVRFLSERNGETQNEADLVVVAGGRSKYLGEKVSGAGQVRSALVRGTKSGNGSWAKSSAGFGGRASEESSIRRSNKRSILGGSVFATYLPGGRKSPK